MNTYYYRWIFITLLISLYSLNSFSQDDCSCEEQFVMIRDYLKENYPFYKMKTEGKNLALYNSYNEIMQARSKNIETTSSCLPLLRKYTDIFRDGHIMVRYNKQELDKKMNAISNYNKAEIIELSQINSAPIVGIYSFNKYRVAIIPSKSPNFDFDGVLIEDANEKWKTRDIKFRLNRTEDEETYKVDYSTNSRSLYSSYAYIKNFGGKTMLMIDGFSPLFREDHPIDLEKFDSDMQDDVFTFKRLSEKTFLIKAKSFGGQYKLLVDSLSKKHHHEIIACENLILDVRNNGGGSDHVYYPILPYIYSGPVQLDGVSYYLSPDNKALFTSYAQGNDQRIKAMQSKPDFSFLTNNEVYTHEIDTIYNRPLHVAVLHNRLTISSGETFVMRARQSERVITYGVNTAGIVDGFNGNVVDLGCVKLQYPTTLRSHKLPEGKIDPYGISPDVYMPGFMDDPYPFILDHLETMDKF